MNYKSIIKQLPALIIIAFFASCDKDANEIGADIVGNDNFAFGTPSSYKVTAHNADIGPVSSNNLPVNPLGIYNNAVFGKTKANFATQVQLAVENPVFGANVQVDSVMLTVDYYNTRTGYRDVTTGIYEIDSIYGPPSTETKMKLNVYESGYYMRDLDPGTGERQLFYTNENAQFDNLKVGGRLNNDSDVTQNDEFFFNPATNFGSGTVTSPVNGATVREEFGPRLKMFLDKTRFQEKLFSSSAAGQLINNNVFKNYFRGLYFQVEQIGGQEGNLALINFATGKITVKYTEDGPDNDSNPNNELPRVEKSIVLNLTGNTASLIETSDIPPAYSGGLQNADAINGDPRLYLKGGQGSMAVIDLFSELGDLEKLRSEDILINDASLTFTIDNAFAQLGSNKPVEPQRIYLFDIKNKRPIVDFYTDNSSNASNTKLSKLIHGGIIEKSSDGRGTKYKIRLTHHIRGLVNNADSTNVKLGLVVTENIMVADNRKLKNQNGIITDVPLMSVVHPFGTVLYGSNIPEGDPDYDKRLRLEIYYTKPN